MSDNNEIMFEKTLSVKSLHESMSQELRLEDVSITTISSTPIRITSKGPVKITIRPRMAPLITTTPGLVPYFFEKAVPWN